jgi:transcriptional regulator with XRE-family HTH domain
MSLDERARRRIALWLDTNPKVTQKQVAEAAGHFQPWVSSYRKGLVEASLDELAAMAGAFGHTLTELLDLRASEDEQDLIDAYRAVPHDRRDAARGYVWALAPKQRPRGRQIHRVRISDTTPASNTEAIDKPAKRGTPKA